MKTQDPIEEPLIPVDATAEEQVDIMLQVIDGFCQQISEEGVDELLILSTLLTVYAERAADYGDREMYEEHLQAALDEEWETHSVH
jgi:hypothetical protein